MTVSYDEAQSMLGRVRQNYPQYADMDDQALASALSTRFPEYADVADAIRRPTNFTPPTTGAEVDPQLIELARSMPDTEFDFSNYGQTSTQPTERGSAIAPVAPSGQAPGQTYTSPSGNVFTTATPEDAQAQAAQRAGVPTEAQIRETMQSDFLTPDNELGRAAHLFQIEDANVTPIEAAGGWEAYQQQTTREAIEKWPRWMRPIATGVNQSTFSTIGLVGQATDAVGLTEGLSDAANQVVRDQSEARRSLGTTVWEDGAESATRSLVDLITLGRVIPGGTAGSGAMLRLNQSRGVITAFTLKAMNDAEYEGSQAGLRGPELAQYVIAQGATEGVVTSIFSMIGLGGFENAALRGLGGQGFRQALRQFGIQSVGELAEENLISMMGLLWQDLYNVNPEALSEDNIKDTLLQTTIATLMTMGVADGGRRIAAMQHNNQQATQQANEAQAGTAQATETTQTPDGLDAPATGPDGSPLLALPTAEDIAGRRLAEAQADLAAAERGPTTAGEGVITVDPQGRATTPQQQAEIDAIAGQAQQRAADMPLALPAGQDVDVRTIDDTTGQRIAEELGIEFNGVQEGLEGPQYLTFTDNQTGSTFLAEIGDSPRAKLDAQRQAFQAAQPDFVVSPEGVATDMRQPTDNRREAEEDAALPEGIEEDRRGGRGDRRSPDLQAERQRITQLMQEGKTEEAEQAIQDLQERARRDPKGTGLLSGTEFDAQIADLQAEVDASGKPRHIAIFDVANLGLKNTVEGHLAADEGLARIAQVVLDVAGPNASFRTGGDEMGVIFPPGTSKKRANELLAEIERQAGFDQVVDGASMFMVGEVGTLRPGGRVEDVLTDVEHRGEAKKRRVKEMRGEPGSISKDQALQLAQGNTLEDVLAGRVEAPAPVVEEVADTTLPRDVTRRQRIIDARARVEQRRRELREVREGASRSRASAEKATPLEGTAPKHKRRVPRAIETLLTPLSSRIRDLSPRLFDRLMRMEFATNTARERMKKDLHDAATEISADFGAPRNFWSRLKYGYSRVVRGRPKWQDSARYREFKLALMNGDRARAEEILSPEARPRLDEFYTTFRTLFDGMREAGVTIGDLGQNYWARFIRDYESFRKEFGEDTGQFEDAWAIARAVQGRESLTTEQKVEIANAVLAGFGPRKPGHYGPSNARVRTNETVTEDQLDHYIDPLEAAFRYIDGATYTAERSRFLGRNATMEDLGETVGRIVEEEIEAGRLNREDQAEVIDLLNTRFTADMLTMNRHLRTFKQLTYMMTLGQFRSTLTQLTDLAFTATTHGVGHTVTGARAGARLTARDKRIAMEEIGIHDHGEEFKDIGRVARATDWVLRKTGFKAVDRFGKESRINAAMSAMQEAASRPDSKEYQRLQREYEAVLGTEQFQQTMQDLREGNATENVKYLLFLDISRIQPLTLSQMPQAYLDNPNGRILYTLKTFTIMQLDFVRRDMFRRMATPGQRVEGVRSLGRYLVFFALLGLGVEWLKKWLRGDPITQDDLPDSVANVMLGTVGLNRYTVEEAYTDPGQAAINYIAPPIVGADNVARDIQNFAVRPAMREAGEHAPGFVSTDDVPESQEGVRSIRNIPILGELLYFHAPWGRGFHLNQEDGLREYREDLSDLREEAVEALGEGDTVRAGQLLAMYNERRRNGPRTASGGFVDGRQNPLTMQNLRGDLRRDRESQDERNDALTETQVREVDARAELQVRRYFDHYMTEVMPEREKELRKHTHLMIERHDASDEAHGAVERRLNKAVWLVVGAATAGGAGAGGLNWLLSSLGG